MTVCPNAAIHVHGRDISDGDLLPLPEKHQCADYDALRSLLLVRRSVRHFTKSDIEPELVQRILDAASTAPMGLPPSDVKVLVFHGREKVRGFRNDLFAALKSWKWMSTWWGSVIIRPFYGKTTCDVMRGFVRQITEAFETKDKDGVDAFFYDAPLALYFHASSLADPADPVVAATYAMLAAQSLGLGTTMLGTPGVIMKQTRRLKRKYGIDREVDAGLVLIVGRPAVQYHRALRRRFSEIRWWNADESVKTSPS
jgi:nitroreductase